MSDNTFAPNVAPASIDNNVMVDLAITQITSADIETSINALKQLERTLNMSGPNALIPHVNDIVSAITLQIRVAYSSADLERQRVPSVQASRQCAGAGVHRAEAVQGFIQEPVAPMLL